MVKEAVYAHQHLEVKEIRNRQFQVHEQIYEDGTKVPIHFAFGHEAVAVAMASTIQKDDKLLLPHRNIHYLLALGATVYDLVSEYSLQASPISGMKLGSMNLNFPARGAIYTSNILGNNLSVATGVALGNRIKNFKSTVWCVTGDGAIEEGTFYESLLLGSSKELGVIYLVENNRWSLASEIGDRRREIDLELLASSLGAVYQRLSGNNVSEYSKKLSEIRELNLQTNKTFIVEVGLTTLGGYFLENESRKRYVNYHAGRAQAAFISEGIIERTVNDPVWVSEQYLEALVTKKGAR